MILNKIKGFSQTQEAAKVMALIEKRVEGAQFFPNPAVQVKPALKNPTL